MRSKPSAWETRAKKNGTCSVYFLAFHLNLRKAKLRQLSRSMEVRCSCASLSLLRSLFSHSHSLPFRSCAGKKNLFLLAFTENAGKKFWCTYDSHTHMVKREKFRFAKSTRSYTIIVALGTLEKSAGVVIALGNFGRAGMVPLGSSLSCLQPHTLAETR